MFKQWLDQTKVFFVRFKIDQPFFVVTPKFRITLLLLWGVSLTGLAYGHWFGSGDGRSLSLLLSMSGWLGAVFILLLRSPWSRLWRLVRQLAAFLLFFLCLGVGYVAYLISFTISNVGQSTRYFWLVFALLLLYLSVRSIFKALLEKQEESPYPAMYTAPLLFAALLINYIWWQWDQLKHFLP